MKIRGYGPTDADIAFIGEGPGWEEEKHGRPFAGRAGRELARFLDGRDLPTMDAVWLTTLYRHFGGKDYRYTADDLRRDEPALLDELRTLRPRILVPLGRTAIRWCLGDVDLEEVWGIPWQLPPSDKLSFLGNTTVFPITHPAAGFHSPELASLVVAGFQQLALYLDGQFEPRKLFDDPYPEPTYVEIESVPQLEAALAAYDGSPIGCDSEGWAEHPWSIQLSWKPGTAYVVRATADPVLRALGAFLSRVRPRLIFHSSLHDLAVCRALGIDLVGLGVPFDDTMIMAYLLQIEPQGLKPLCVRHCNMRMQDYMDVMGEAGQRVALDYLVWLWEGEETIYESRCEKALDAINQTPLLDGSGQPKRAKDGAVRYRKCSKPPSLPKTQLHKAVQRCLQSKDARKLWENQVEDVRVAAYITLGEMPRATLDLVPRVNAINYGGRDADGTARVASPLTKRIAGHGLADTYQLELATYPLIDRMSQIGMLPDLDHFAKLSTQLAGEIDTLQARLVTLTNDATFNANSGDQVADYLFGTCAIEPLKMTSSGRGSTNDKILEGLERAYPELPVIGDIRSYREYYKLKHTFVDRLPDFVGRYPGDGRVHATFRTTRVVTGRLAASDPNLLAMPKHGKFAKAFRRGWVAGPNHVLGSWDLSQIELRIAAHLSQDPVMLAIYRGERRNKDGSAIDLHAALAERIFGVAPAVQDDSKHRLPAKAINFGFWMGQTNKGLLVELLKNGIQVGEDDAQKWLDDAHKLYRGAKPYMDARAAEARRNGYVRCMSGRIRYIGGIHSTNDRIREEAERFAFATPVQEGAQFVMKTNEAVLWNDIIKPLWREGRWIEPLLQVHDDLILEIADDVAQDVHPMMVECMERSFTGLSVPIKTSGDWGWSWGSLTAFD